MAQNKGYLKSNRKSSGDEQYTPFYAVAPIVKYLKIVNIKLFGVHLMRNGVRMFRHSEKKGLMLFIVLFLMEKIFFNMNQKNLMILLLAILLFLKKIKYYLDLINLTNHLHFFYH